MLQKNFNSYLLFVLFLFSLLMFFCLLGFSFFSVIVISCGGREKLYTAVGSHPLEIVGGNSNKFSPHESAAQMNGVIWAVGDF